MSHGVALYITIGVLGTIAGAIWLIWWTSRGSGSIAPQETTHIWDDDLTEYNNPLPRWWMWLFILSIIFAIGYLALYPGLGNFKGLLNWTEVSQWRGDQQSADLAFEQRFAVDKDKSLAELSKDPAAIAAAKNLFALNCAACHGSDARGAKGFPNLTDVDWLWGGSEQAVYQSIAHGRDGAMPAWGPVIGEQGVDNVMAYVLTLSGREASPTAANAGKTTFETLCSACHGLDGKGNQLIGAPNLTDNVWLHGGSPQDIRESITNGRTNHMPGQLERLGETKVRLLAAYVLDVSRSANEHQ